jgi:hypothetical protein
VSLSPDGRTQTVRVPFAITKRGGCKLVIVLDGASWQPPRPRINNTMVKALARAHRWKRMLENGDYATLQELAKAEKINISYLSRVLRLTLLAPDIVEAILDGRQPEGLQLASLLEPFPLVWERQRRVFFDRQALSSL